MKPPTHTSEDRITIDPEVCNGKPTIRGKRITAQTILEFLGAGESREEILRQFPSLEAEDIDACLESPYAPGNLTEGRAYSKALLNLVTKNRREMTLRTG